MEHEHPLTSTMNGLYCPTCGKFLKDIPQEKKPENKPEPKSTRKTPRKTK